MRAFAVAAVLLLAVSASIAAPFRDSPQLRLIKFSEDKQIWMTEEEVLTYIRERELAGIPGTGFRDITDVVDRPMVRNTFRRAFPSTPSQQTLVNQLVRNMSAANLESFLNEFTSFHTRYYDTDTGVESHEWLRDYMQDIANAAGRTEITCSLFEHSFPQPSVICRVPGVGSNADEVVVCSAHSDSINSLSPRNGRSPGADDDGSGVADFVEVYRAVVQGGFRPNRTIEFIGYAAEEVGLRGSADIAADYASRGVNVYGIYHNEMSGYPGSQRKITILEDYVDAELTAFLQKLVPVYTSLEYQAARCGYGCSDHASWTEYGFPAICTAEAGPFGEVNPEMHTADDDMDIFDAEFSLEFAKLALGMVVELTQY